MNRDLKCPPWPVPQSLLLGPESVVFHCGLGAGDSVGHRQVRSLKILGKLKAIAQEIQKKLKSRSATAEELSLFGIELLEREPLFNAGRGAKLQRDGRARLSAAVMRGHSQTMAGVSNLEAQVTSSRVAQRLLDKKDRSLTGFLASQFALSEGFEFESPETPARVQEWKEKQEGESGTVGCISLDKNLQSFASTSTGGRGYERPGRVSDSCTPAGNFANPWGAVSCTGTGEDILDAGLAVALLTRLEDGMSLQEATLKSFARFSRRNFGLIALDRHGQSIVHATHGTLGFGIVSKNHCQVGLSSRDWDQLVSQSHSSRP